MKINRTDILTFERLNLPDLVHEYELWSLGYKPVLYIDSYDLISLILGINTKQFNNDRKEENNKTNLIYALIINGYFGKLRLLNTHQIEFSYFMWKKSSWYRSANIDLKGLFEKYKISNELITYLDKLELYEDFEKFYKIRKNGAVDLYKDLHKFFPLQVIDRFNHLCSEKKLLEFDTFNEESSIDLELARRLLERSCDTLKYKLTSQSSIERYSYMRTLNNDCIALAQLISIDINSNKEYPVFFSSSKVKMKVVIDSLKSESEIAHKIENRRISIIKNEDDLLARAIFFPPNLIIDEIDEKFSKYFNEFDTSPNILFQKLFKNKASWDSDALATLQIQDSIFVSFQEYLNQYFFRSVWLHLLSNKKNVELAFKELNEPIEIYYEDQLVDIFKDDKYKVLKELRSKLNINSILWEVNFGADLFKERNFDGLIELQPEYNNLISALGLSKVEVLDFPYKLKVIGENREQLRQYLEKLFALLKDSDSNKAKSTFKEIILNNIRKGAEKENLPNAYLVISILLKLELYELVIRFIDLKTEGLLIQEIGLEFLRSKLVALVLSNGKKTKIKSTLAKLYSKDSHQELIRLLTLLPNSLWIIDYLKTDLIENSESLSILTKMTQEQSKYSEKILYGITDLESKIFETNWNIDLLSENISLIMEQIENNVLDEKTKEHAINKLKDPEISIKHKLRFVIPLIIFSYIAEVEVANKQNFPKSRVDWLNLLLKKGVYKENLLP